MRQQEFFGNEPAGNAKPVGDLLARNVAESRRQKNSTPSRRKLSHNRPECNQVGPRQHDFFGSWRIIGKLQQTLDLGGRYIAVLQPALIRCHIQRHAKKIITRTLDRSDGFHASQTQPCIVHGIAGEIRRTQPPRQPRLQIVVTVDKDPTDRGQGLISHGTIWMGWKSEAQPGVTPGAWGTIKISTGCSNPAGGGSLNLTLRNAASIC